MGKECLQIFLNLKLTTEEEDIDECIKALEASFKPKRNIVYERYLFNMCQQNSGETMDSYVNRLQKAASTCQFGTLTEELMRSSGDWFTRPLNKTSSIERRKSRHEQGSKHLPIK